mmetsp:Transcript_11594/g.32866  ORF Transcript_11594/g.32866 Transcript_11594/m.32866 type:complete len:149 (+) Transcript_11594:157-603(+)
MVLCCSSPVGGRLIISRANGVIRGHCRPVVPAGNRAAPPAAPSSPCSRANGRLSGMPSGKRCRQPSSSAAAWKKERGHRPPQEKSDVAADMDLKIQQCLQLYKDFFTSPVATLGRADPGILALFATLFVSLAVLFCLAVYAVLIEPQL